MADQETVERLRSSGQRVWNAWRKQHPTPNLRGAALRGLDLEDHNLSGANLVNARLSGSKLDGADLSVADLTGADLTGCSLYSTVFAGAKLTDAMLTDAVGEMALFLGTDLSGTDLTRARLHNCLFAEAIFRETIFDGTELWKSDFGATVFVGVNLAAVEGLETASHDTDSALDHRTLSTCSSVSSDFLRGCGLPDVLIDRLPDLFGGVRYRSCFVSYARSDARFVTKLTNSLRRLGVHYWRDEERMRGGVDLVQELHDQVGSYDCVILVASLDALARRYVRMEVEPVLDKTTDQGDPKLLPIMIDAGVMRSRSQLGVALRNRHMVYIDFTKWQERSPYRRALRKLARSLEIGPPTTTSS